MLFGFLVAFENGAKFGSVPNVQFQIDDAECEWTFGEDVFDLVHIRHLNGGIDDWSALLREAYKWVILLNVSLAAKVGNWN